MGRYQVILSHKFLKYSALKGKLCSRFDQNRHLKLNVLFYLGSSVDPVCINFTTSIICIVHVVKRINEYLLGEPLGKNYKIETLKRLNIYILAYQAIIRSCMKLIYIY